MSLADFFKSKEKLVEEVVVLLHDDKTKAEWDEKDRQSTRDYYQAYSPSELRFFVQDIKRTSRR